MYLREAHPTDGWVVPDYNQLEDPATLEERSACAADAGAELAFGFPIVVDTMDDRIAVRWSAAPERLFVIEKGGRVIYTGSAGPFGFRPGGDYVALAGNRGLSLEAFLGAWSERR